MPMASALVRLTLISGLVQYLREASTPKERNIAYQLFCEQPMKIPSEQLRFLLEEDMWDS